MLDNFNLVYFYLFRLNRQCGSHTVAPSHKNTYSLGVAPNPPSQRSKRCGVAHRLYKAIFLPLLMVQYNLDRILFLKSDKKIIV